MKIRKRTARGHYESIEGKGSASERPQRKGAANLKNDRSFTEEDKIKEE